MSSSKKIQIYGKTYSLKSSSSEMDAEELAGYVDSRMRELGRCPQQNLHFGPGDPRRAQYCTGINRVKRSDRGER